MVRALLIVGGMECDSSQRGNDTAVAEWRPAFSAENLLESQFTRAALSFC